MKTACHAAVLASLGALVLSADAVAAPGSIKDERSTGSSYPQSMYAACDISSLSAETTKRFLTATVETRAPRTGQSVVFLLNTAGSPTSAPEYEVNGSGEITRLATGSMLERSATLGRGANPRAFTVNVPLAAIGKPRKVGVQVRTCGEGAVDIAPGGDYFDSNPPDEIPPRYVIATRAERTISGTVMLNCEGEKSCRRVAVPGATVIATGGGETYTGVSDQQGRYEVAADRGIYKVKAKADVRIKGQPKRIDLRTAKSATAHFEACGLAPETIASASAVAGGRWKGGNRDCLNLIELSWRPSSGGLLMSWSSIPICMGSSNNYLGKPARILNGQPLDPSRPGENLTVSANKIEFFYPINGVHSGNNIGGTLSADGTGVASAKFVQNPCTYSIAGLKLKRG